MKTKLHSSSKLPSYVPTLLELERDGKISITLQYKQSLVDAAWDEKNKIERRIDRDKQRLADMNSLLENDCRYERAVHYQG